MPKFLVSLIALSLLPLSYVAAADVEQEKIYLTQIINQLNAVQPLIIAAQKQQPSNMRIQFHYTRYYDSQGKPHNGLLEDINEIKKSILEKIDYVPVEPRLVNPIQGDYLRMSSGDKPS